MVTNARGDRLIEIRDPYEDKECVICLERFTKKDPPITHDSENGKKHDFFHTRCLIQIPGNPIPCPLCRCLVAMDPEDRILQPAILAAKRKEALEDATYTAALTAIFQLSVILSVTGIQLILDGSGTAPAGACLLGGLCAFIMGGRSARNVENGENRINISAVSRIANGVCAGMALLGVGWVVTALLHRANPLPIGENTAIVTAIGLVSCAVVTCVTGVWSLFARRASSNTARD